MPNKVKFNLKNVHWALATTGGYAGTVSEWPGAVSLTANPQSDDYVFHADGIEYYEYHVNKGYEGELECALVPEVFRQQVLGEVKDSNNNLVELDDVEVIKFALGFQIDGDEKDNYYWLYNCQASRTAIEGKTNGESVEVLPEKMSFANKPDPRITVGTNKHPVKVKTADASTTTAGSWFSAVVLPNVTTG